MQPKIKIHGWWWKKFFPKYRKLNKVMNELSAYVYKAKEKEIQDKLVEAVLSGQYMTPKRRNWSPTDLDN